MGNRFFFTKNPKCKKKEKIYFLFSVLGRGGGGGGGGAGGKCFFFYKESKSTHFFGGGGMEGVVWRGGSVARVDVNSVYK